MANEEIKNHVIVCGYGIVGEKIVDTLLEKKINLIVIEIDHAKVEALRERGIDVIEGDATSSKVLRDAGIERAKVVAMAMDNDAKNLFGVITAKSLNEKIIIATRANDEFMRDKLSEAGADFVAMPNKSASAELFKAISKGI